MSQSCLFFTVRRRKQRSWNLLEDERGRRRLNDTAGSAQCGSGCEKKSVSFGLALRRGGGGRCGGGLLKVQEGGSRAGTK